MKMKTIIISRHSSFVDYVVDVLQIKDHTVVPHADPATLSGHVVTSGLPLHLAALCDTVTTIPLNLPPDLRGVELTLDQMRQYAGAPQTFKVSAI